MANQFKIEGTNIKLALDSLEADEFVVKSMPYNYEVCFVKGKRIQSEIQKIIGINKENHFVFIDQIVAELYVDNIFANQDLFTVEAKESNKVLPVATKLLDKLQQKNFTKREIFLSVGGGITQDISAFGRAVFKRGINWTYIPTTLLAMGDSCIGAKSCLNYGKVKNQLGLFSAPQKVFINTDFLKTLSEIDVLSGYGEIIKLAIVGGKVSIDKFIELTSKQTGNRLKYIDELIKLSLLVKKSVIEIDEFEKDIRKALNYGHTIGHAIEPLVKYKIPHGIAVSIGCYIENLISVKYGQLSYKDAKFLNDLIYPFIDKASLKLIGGLSEDDIIGNMKRDKKAISNDIFMAVPFNIGHFDLLKVVIDEPFKLFLQNTLQELSL